MTAYEIERARQMATFIWENLPEQTIPVLIHPVVDLCSKYSIKIRGQDLNKKIDGYTTHLIGTNKYLIVIDNVNYPIARQRFTMANELGHIVLGHHTSRKSLSRHLKERSADEFASRLLMPDEPLTDICHMSPQLAASYFGVSKQAMEIRLEHFSKQSKRTDPLGFIIKWGPVFA